MDPRVRKAKIRQLVSLWFSCLIDHHKDRDCHFHISKDYSYDGQINYSVQHYGYVYKEVVDEYNTWEEAEQALYKLLIKMIRSEIATWEAQDPKAEMTMHFTMKDGLHTLDYFKGIKVKLEEIINE